MDDEGEYFRNGRPVREPYRTLGELDMMDERETDPFFGCLMRNGRLVGWLDGNEVK
jgi:hypothetical protein